MRAVVAPERSNARRSALLCLCRVGVGVGIGIIGVGVGACDLAADLSEPRVELRDRLGGKGALPVHPSRKGLYPRPRLRALLPPRP